MAKGRRGRGEGGIEKLPSGSYRAVVCRTAPDGKRTRQSFTSKSKADAVAWLAKAHESGPSPAGTFGEWLDRWLALHKSRVAAKTYRNDEWVVNAYLSAPELKRVRLRDLKPVQLETHVRSLACSPAQQHKAAKALRGILNAAVAAGLLPASPLAGAKLPARPKPDARSLTEAELATLVRHADLTRWGYAFRLWADAGLRPGELLGLTWADFDPAAGTIRVERAVCGATGDLKDTKTPKGRRTLVLASSTVAALLAARPPAGAGPLVPTKRGLHWWPDNFSEDVFRPLVRAAGVKATPYTLRHTTATLLLRAGVNLKVVSERLGHESVTMTLEVYAHVLPGDQERAAEAMGVLLPTFSPRPSEEST